MKKSFLLISLAACFFQLQAQLNLTLTDSLSYSFRSTFLSDIWGYVDTTGKEYAIVGLTAGGVSIVDISDPANAEEVFFRSGPETNWRDIKTWNKHAYVTNENSGGLQIIDLSALPDTNLTVTYFTTGGWTTAHNLFIDEFGVCYIFGANRGNGGVIMYDLTQDPNAPVEIGKYDTYYGHDGMARGDTLYIAHINDGFFTVLDVSNKSAPSVLGTKQTSGNKTHNIWISDDGNYAFTTDEISNGFIGAYDISNLNNIQEIDLIQSSPGENVIPHNTHFFNNYLVTSYYNDGTTIHDVSDPYNMVEVGNYDSSPYSGSGFTGAWGTYPWLPSGKIISSDVTQGLFIFTPNYVRGCYLKGVVKELGTNVLLNNVSVKIIQTSEVDLSKLTGDYAIGTGVPGNYSVEFSKAGYHSDTVISVSFSRGAVTTLNVELEPAIPFSFSGMIRETGSSIGIPFSKVKMISDKYLYDVTADSIGHFLIPEIFEADYEIFAGKWEYRTTCLAKQKISAAVNSVDIQLQKGFYDDFIFDFGWTVTGTAIPGRGKWERGKPIGTFVTSLQLNPASDISTDCFVNAYITGISDQIFNDVDGFTILTSPVFDATNFNQPYLNYYRWFFNYGEDYLPGNDSLTVLLSNGDTLVQLEVVLGATSSFIAEWIPVSKKISDYITPSDSMKIIFRVGDRVSQGDDITEAGVDAFQLTEYPLSINEIASETASLKVYPNPTSGYVNIMNPYSYGTSTLEMYNSLGKRIFSKGIQPGEAVIKIEEDLIQGTYVFRLTTSTGHFITAKFIRL